MFAGAFRWIDANVLALGRELRLSYLPPLMIYAAAGISGLTGIVGTFFVKDYLRLSAAFLAALGFWAGIPYVIKLPIGHLVDLIWRWKSWLVFLGAGLIAASLLIMAGLLTDRAAVVAIIPAEAWFVLSELLAPVGFVIQDVVADAMTVEAVPRVDRHGRPVDPADRKRMNVTMQTLGRVAIIGGTVLVALVNLYLFADVEQFSQAQRAVIYRDVFLSALSIPLISVAGVALAHVLRGRDLQRLVAQGIAPLETGTPSAPPAGSAAPIGGTRGAGLPCFVSPRAMGCGLLPSAEELVSAGSSAIVVFLTARAPREPDPAARPPRAGTA